MAISFAGVELLLEDQDGELMKFLDHYLPVEDLRIWSKAQVFNNTRSCRIGSIALPNYPQDSRIKLNTLYWPTGATRWAYIHCLASDSIKEAILDDLNGENEPRILSITDDLSRPIQTSMYMLPPRPLTCVELTPDDSGENAWLLTFVDERYFWQFKTVGDLQLSSRSTWDSVISRLETVSGLTIDRNDIPAAYQSPNACLLGKYKANLASVMDTVAHSIGCRLVRGIDESVSMLEWKNDDIAKDTSSKRYKENLDLTWYQTAGDEFINEHACAVIPETVTVVFKRSIKVDGIDSFAIVKNSDDYADSSLGNTVDITQIFKSTAIADNSDDSDVIANEDDLSDLADQIAKDFYRSISKRYDRTFAGIMKWFPTGWDDAIEWSLGRRRPDGSREIQTRVRSAPYNLTIEEMYHTSGDDELCDCSEGGQTVRIMGAKVTRTVAEGVTTLEITGDPTGGTLILGVGSDWTADLSRTSSASDIKTALEALSIVGSGNVTATGGPFPAAVTIEITGGDSAGKPVRVRYGKLTGGSVAASEANKIPCSILEGTDQTDRVILARLLGRNWVPGLDTIAVESDGWVLSPCASMLYGTTTTAISAGGGTGKVSMGGMPWNAQPAVNRSADAMAIGDEVIGFAYNGQWSVNLEGCPSE